MGTVTSIIKRPCECEHAAHFHETPKTKDLVVLTPNGNPGHRYGAKYAAVRRVKTPWSSFMVCKDCREDCLSHYPEVK